MMRVTNKTFGMIASNRAKAHQQFVMVQRMRKDGTWGQPLQARKFGNESDEEVVERLVKNNCVEYRIAE